MPDGAPRAVLSVVAFCPIISVKTPTTMTTLRPEVRKENNDKSATNLLVNASTDASGCLMLQG